MLQGAAAEDNLACQLHEWRHHSHRSAIFISKYLTKKSFIYLILIKIVFRQFLVLPTVNRRQLLLRETYVQVATTSGRAQERQATTLQCIKTHCNDAAFCALYTTWSCAKNIHRTRATAPMTIGGFFAALTKDPRRSRTQLNGRVMQPNALPRIHCIRTAPTLGQDSGF